MQLSTQALKEYIGSNGPRNIISENGHLFYQQENGGKKKMNPIVTDVFAVDGSNADGYVDRNERN